MHTNFVFVHKFFIGQKKPHEKKTPKKQKNLTPRSGLAKKNLTLLEDTSNGKSERNGVGCGDVASCC
jgi:hypothetical protein